MALKDEISYPKLGIIAIIITLIIVAINVKQCNEAKEQTRIEQLQLAQAEQQAIAEQAILERKTEFYNLVKIDQKSFRRYVDNSTFGQMYSFICLCAEIEGKPILMTIDEAAKIYTQKELIEMCMKIHERYANVTQERLPVFQDESFPVIKSLEANDPIFKQYLADMDLARRRLRQNQTKEQLAEILQIYSYNSKGNEDIFRIAARCNVPQSTLATLNRISHPSMFKGGIVLLPTVPGIFLSEMFKNDLEKLITAGRKPEEGIIISVPGNGRFLFLPGADFFPEERSFFLSSQSIY